MPKNKNVKEYKVHSLERGIDLLEILSKCSSERSLTELSKDAGFNQTTAHRILVALKSRGYVRQNPENSRYRLTLRLFEIGSRIVHHLNLHEEALPVLKSVADETGESVFLVILEEDEALCIENINAYRHIQLLFLRVGKRMPLNIGAAPRVLLAYMPEEYVDELIEKRGLQVWTKKSISTPKALKADLKKIRDQGYALSMNDVTDGAAALGCPIYNWKGEVVAAVSISGVSDNFTKRKLPGFIKTVKKAAYEISKRLDAPLESPDVQKLRT